MLPSRKTLNRQASRHSPWPGFVNDQEEAEGEDKDDWCRSLDEGEEEKLIDLWIGARQIACVSRQVVAKLPSNATSSGIKGLRNISSKEVSSGKGNAVGSGSQQGLRRGLLLPSCAAKHEVGSGFCTDAHACSVSREFDEAVNVAIDGFPPPHMEEEELHAYPLSSQVGGGSGVLYLVARENTEGNRSLVSPNIVSADKNLGVCKRS